MKKIKLISTILGLYATWFMSDLHSGTIQYVVAHYNEDLTWLLPYASKAQVYHKGSSSSASTLFARWNKLPNVGREGHTYLYHIINNYNNLADVTFFLQGKIYDHACGQTLDDLLHEVIKEGIAFLGVPLHPRVGCTDSGYISFLRFWKEIFHHTLPLRIIFYSGACFAVKKELIYSHKIEFYRQILRYLNHHICPKEGYHLERMWYYIFDPIAATK